MHVAVASDCYQIEGMDERKEYIATRNAVDVRLKKQSSRKNKK